MNLFRVLKHKLIMCHRISWLHEGWPHDKDSFLFLQVLLFQPLKHGLWHNSMPTIFKVTSAESWLHEHVTEPFHRVPFYPKSRPLCGRMPFPSIFVDLVLHWFWAVESDCEVCAKNDQQICKWVWVHLWCPKQQQHFFYPGKLPSKFRCSISCSLAKL